MQRIPHTWGARCLLDLVRTKLAELLPSQLGSLECLKVAAAMLLGSLGKQKHLPCWMSTEDKHGPGMAIDISRYLGEVYSPG